MVHRKSFVSGQSHIFESSSAAGRMQAVTWRCLAFWRANGGISGVDFWPSASRIWSLHWRDVARFRSLRRCNKCQKRRTVLTVDPSVPTTNGTLGPGSPITRGTGSVRVGSDRLQNGVGQQRWTNCGLAVPPNASTSVLANYSRFS